MKEMQYDVIHCYSRADAIKDGNLFDVSEMAKEAGFKIPVAVTSGVWWRYVKWDDKDTLRQTSQDTKRRLWDILFLLYISIKKNPDESEIHYGLNVVPRDGVSESAKFVQLRAVIDGGDDYKPVITIMCLDED